VIGEFDKIDSGGVFTDEDMDVLSLHLDDIGNVEITVTDGAAIKVHAEQERVEVALDSRGHLQDVTRCQS